MTANELAELLIEAANTANSQKFATRIELHPLGIAITMHVDGYQLSRIVSYSALINSKCNIIELNLNECAKQLARHL